MNQHASDAPRRDGDQSPGDDGISASETNQFSDPDANPFGAEQSDAAVGRGGSAGVDDAQPVGRESDSASGAPIRVGSPFAVDPFAPQKAKQIEPFYDVGPLRYTAMGAVAASIMVLGFAGVAAWWFPAGGALIAALGCVLSIFGLYSSFRIASSGLLAVHLGVFVLSYVRSLG